MGKRCGAQAATPAMSVATPTWVTPATPPVLAADEVHLWRADLDAIAARRDLSATLSPDEQERAARFVFARDRERFVAARGLLRSLLSSYTACELDMLHFGYGPHGKPFLPGIPIEFNLSHSDRTALIAVSLVHRVGIDIERIRQIPEYMAIAADLFSQQEYTALEAIPEALRQAAFFDCWVRKEAFAKACGEGLAMPLKQFTVSLRPGEPAALLSWKEGQSERWSLHAIDARPEYAAACVIEGSAGLRLFDAWLSA